MPVNSLIELNAFDFEFDVEITMSVHLCVVCLSLRRFFPPSIRQKTGGTYGIPGHVAYVYQSMK